MKTATVGELQHQFARIARWIEEGETIEITRGGQRFAILTPAFAEEPRRFEMPDFEARLKRLLPDAKVHPPGTIQRIIDYDRGER